MSAGPGRRPIASRPRAGGSARLDPRGALGLFGEVLLVGLLVVLGSIPLVTAVPSVAAGIAHLRRQVAGLDVGVARFARDWWSAVRALWPLGLGAVALALLFDLDARLASSGVLPGAQVVAAAVALGAAIAVVVLLRAAGAWSDGEGRPTSLTARAALARGAGLARDDLGGSALLVAAVALCGVLLWMLVPLVVAVGGLLALAVVGVEARPAARPLAEHPRGPH